MGLVGWLAGWLALFLSGASSADDATVFDDGQLRGCYTEPPSQD